MVKGEALKKAYQNCIAKTKDAIQITNDNGSDYRSNAVKDAWKLADIAWRFVGKCQATLSRALLLDCYFNPQRSNEEVCPHFYEVLLPRVFKFWDDDLLFPDLIKELGLVIESSAGFWNFPGGACRGQRPVHSLVAGWTGPGRI